MHRSILALALLGVIAASNSGCLVLAATVIYVATRDPGELPPQLKDGWLEQTLPYPIDTVRTATTDVLEANNLSVIPGESADTKTSRYGDGLDITIELTAPTDHSTAARIKVGPDGHLDRSTHLLNTIAEFAQAATN